MALIKWNDSLSVGMADIDRQHQKLIAMINELNDAMLQRRGKDVMAGIINGLIEYTGSHFKTEEQYFDRFSYPGSLAHKGEHTGFVQKVAGFKAEFDAGKIGLSISVIDFLSDWLKNHIKVVDKKYAPFLAEKGVK